MFPAKITAATPSTLPTFSLGHEKEITLEGKGGLDIVQQLVVKGIRGVYTHGHAQAPGGPKQTCPQIDLISNTAGRSSYTCS